LNLRAGPGTIYEPIDFLENGMFLDIQGRIANNEWILVSPIGSELSGWVSAEAYLVEINIEFEAIEIVETPPPPPSTQPTPTPSPTVTDHQVTFAPQLLDPQNNAGQYRNRIDLEWDWPGTLGPDDYFRVEIWNRYNVCCPFADGEEFANNVIPIDVAWVKNKFYRYDEVEEAFDREFKWRITVVRGIPPHPKQWSTPENEVWEPAAQFEVITDPSEMRTLFVEPGEEPPPSSSSNSGDGSGKGGGCPPGDRSC
jgi:hypothetical protein